MASPYEQKIWIFLADKLGNEYGAAAMMGNLYAESGLYPDRVEGDVPYSSVSQTYTALVDAGLVTEDDFVHNGSGYGLAQWTYYSRKQDLWNNWKSGGYSSIANIDLQLNFLYAELIVLFPSVLSTLKNATSIRQASDKVLHDFENPADQSVSVEVYRASLGQGYYDRFATGSGGGGTDPDNPTPTPTPNPSKRKNMSLLMMYAATRRRF